MYEEITQAIFRNIIGKDVRTDAEKIIYGLSIIDPLLKDMRYEEILPLLIGNDGLIETMDKFSKNVDIILKDRLFDEKTMVYFLNEFNLPVKMQKEDYELMIKKSD